MLQTWAISIAGSGLITTEIVFTIYVMVSISLKMTNKFFDTEQWWRCRIVCHILSLLSIIGRLRSTLVPIEWNELTYNSDKNLLFRVF